MTRRSAFRQADLVPALKAAKEAGLEVSSFEITPDGRIITASDLAEPLNPVEARRRRVHNAEPKGWGE